MSLHLSSFYATFEASIRSVGTAVTLAGVGIYLHRMNVISVEEKRTLAKISKQVIFPLFLFTKSIYCNQNWSDQPCPDITKILKDVWMLLVWPIYVVGMGILVGYGAAWVSSTPKQQRRSVLAACGFSNSTGLPITLLTVVHANFPSTSDLGAVDPTLFLSVYLLLYPVLQWGIGGWLLAPDEQQQEEKEETSSILSDSTTTSSASSSSSSCKVQVDLERSSTSRTSSENDEHLIQPEVGETTALLIATEVAMDNYQQQSNCSEENKVHKTLSNLSTLGKKIVSTCFPPPVVGALLGIGIAATPLRGMFVDMVDRDSDAPLEWLFDGLYEAGQAAVPLNMMILGCNLSASSQRNKNSIVGSQQPKNLLSNKTMAAVVVGKMVIMPVIGILSTLFLQHYILDIPDGKFTLVA